MIRPDLKPCPFCGLHLMVLGIGSAMHPASGCLLTGAVIHRNSFPDWNRRAIAPEAVEGGAA